MDRHDDTSGRPAGSPSPAAAAWLDGLRAALGLPASEGDRAEAEALVAFYEEFLADAVEAGKPEAEVLARLGEPGAVAALSLAERSLREAERRPGPFRLATAARKTLGRTAPLAGRVALSLASLVPFLAGMTCYLGGFLLFLAVPAAGWVAMDDLASVVSPVPEAGVRYAGVLLAAVGLLVGAGWLLWAAGNRLGRLTVRMLRASRGSGGAAGMASAATRATGAGTFAAPKERKPRRLLRTTGALLVAAVLWTGVVLLAGTGLAYDYFSLWNSMAPRSTVHAEPAFDAAGIGTIQVQGRNSRIRVVRIPGTSIRVLGDVPDWVRLFVAESDGTLVVAEQDNGRMPLFRILAIHEGVTDIEVGVPESFAVPSIRIVTQGGAVDIDVPADDLFVRTGTGPIRLSPDHYQSVPDGVKSRRGVISIERIGDPS